MTPGTKYLVTVQHDGTQWRGTICKRTWWLFTTHLWHCLCDEQDTCQDLTFRKLGDLMKEDEE